MILTILFMFVSIDCKLTPLLVIKMRTKVRIFFHPNNHFSGYL